LVVYLAVRKGAMWVGLMDVMMVVSMVASMADLSVGGWAEYLVVYWADWRERIMAAWLAVPKASAMVASKDG
jgi:hypothetical protein